MITVAIRPLASRDIPSILQIQESSPQAAQWSEDAYHALGRAGENVWLADQNGNLAGFLVARRIAAEMEILNLAVHLNLRRQGIASALLRAALLWGAKEGPLRVFLEVRLSNTGAQKFYEAHGFSVGGKRRNYYRGPDEDALLLSRVLSGDDSLILPQ